MAANFNTLTSKQKKVYAAIESYIKTNNIPPTVRELGEMIGEKTPGAVQGILSRLEQKGEKLLTACKIYVKLKKPL